MIKNIFRKNNSAFSLTEMSIVIIVIGVLMGAMLKGKNLIDKAKLRAIISENSTHTVSLNSFYTKYSQYPGDFDLAEDYWGAGNTDAGDNDGKIEFKIGSIYEGYRAWQHLSFAGMTDGAYLGNETTGAAQVEIDVPLSKSKGGFFLEYGTHGFTENNALVLGTPIAVGGSAVVVNGLFTANDAMEIDAKIDDSVATTGSVRGQDGDGSDAQDCVVTASSIYKISNSDPDCTLAFEVYP